MRFMTLIFFIIQLLYLTNEWCLETCKTGEYCEYYTLCRNCNIENCSACSDSSTCTQCLAGFYMEYSNCKECPSQCTTCSAITECASCHAGYYISGGSCFNCPTGCATCSSTGATCSSCLSGYYLNGTSCWNCMWNCAKCTDPNSCLACAEKFTGPHCQCQEPEVWNSTSQTCVQSQNWAVLICGTSGFSNYRQQADVCHAYQTLINKGIAADNIIVFSYNDAATASDNPYKGKLFNKPCNMESNCWDVYNGCKIDYSGADVTVNNILNVLSANSEAMKHIGSGKVLKSNSADNIFIYYSTDGGKGILEVPGGKYLYANNLSNVLNSLNKDNRYNQIVFYLEASSSGSMTQNYSPSLNIYFLTSASATGESYGTYCDEQVMGVYIDSCLGDLFSINWLEYTDFETVSEITLEQQYSYVQKQSTKSQVTQWGDLSFTGETVGQFMGQNAINQEQVQENQMKEVINYRQIEIQRLKNRWLRDQTNLTKKIDYFEEIIKNDKATLFFTQIARDVNRVDLLEEGSNISITNWDCYKGSIELYESKCMKLTAFSKYYLNVLAGLCEDERNVDPIYYLNEKIKQYC